MRRRPSFTIGCAVLALLPGRTLGQEARPEPPPAVTAIPPASEFLILPLRVHVLRSDDLPEANCGLSDADIDRILKKVNGIWHPAGIHFGLESIVREPAEPTDRYRLARNLALGDADEDEDDQDDAEPKARRRRRVRLPNGLFRLLRPEASRAFDGLHVYYVHDFDVNGVYMGSDYAFVKETASLRPVEGGIDEPLPRVTAHELGHALGLPHRQDRTNLLASGTTGTGLSAAEIERARERARGRKGVLTFADLTADGPDLDAPARERRARWRAEIPGAVGAKPEPEPAP